MVNEFDRIDFVSLNGAGEVVLTISDHLEWNDENEHILTLQEKINRYLGFIQCGQLHERYTHAKRRRAIKWFRSRVTSEG